MAWRYAMSFPMTQDTDPSQKPTPSLHEWQPKPSTGRKALKIIFVGAACAITAAVTASLVIHSNDPEIYYDKQVVNAEIKRLQDNGFIFYPNPE
jgi:hypothetical protein